MTRFLWLGWNLIKVWKIMSGMCHRIAITVKALLSGKSLSLPPVFLSLSFMRLQLCREKKYQQCEIVNNNNNYKKWRHFSFHKWTTTEFDFVGNMKNRSYERKFISNSFSERGNKFYAERLKKQTEQHTKNANIHLSYCKRAESRVTLVLFQVVLHETA